MNNIFNLLKERDQILVGLSSMQYGSIEKRNVNGKVFLYVHQRIGNTQRTQYVGEYTQELLDAMNSNNRIAASLKKRLKEVDKRLVALGYHQGHLRENTEICVSLASRYLAEYIYNQAAIEGLPTTYECTEALIYEGGVSGLSLKEIQTIVSLKEGWRFIMSEEGLFFPPSLDLFSTINAIVEKDGQGAPGSIRTVPVKIRNTRYLPPLPIKEEVEEDISSLLKNEPSPEIGIRICLYIMKRQIYRDGNKRTAVLAANHYLMKEGLGLLNIPKENDSEFFSLLKQYYEEGKEEEIRSFLLDRCFLDVSKLIEDGEKERKKLEQEYRERKNAVQ